MIQLFRAFIDEVAHRGVKGLAELIAPQGRFALVGFARREANQRT